MTKSITADEAYQATIQSSQIEVNIDNYIIYVDDLIQTNINCGEFKLNTIGIFIDHDRNESPLQHKHYKAIERYYSQLGYYVQQAGKTTWGLGMTWGLCWIGGKNANTECIVNPTSITCIQAYEKTYKLINIDHHVERIDQCIQQAIQHDKFSVSSMEEIPNRLNCSRTPIDDITVYKLQRYYENLNYTVYMSKDPKVGMKISWNHFSDNNIG